MTNPVFLTNFLECALVEAGYLKVHIPTNRISTEVVEQLLVLFEVGVSRSYDSGGGFVFSTKKIEPALVGRAISFLTVRGFEVFWMQEEDSKLRLRVVSFDPETSKWIVTRIPNKDK